MIKETLIIHCLKKILCLLIICFGLKSYSQLSKKHFIPPLTNAANASSNPEDQYIYLSTPNKADVSYTIIPIGLPETSHITGTVSNAVPQEIAIGNGNTQLFIPSIETSVVRNDKGFIIESEAPIYVSVRMNAGNVSQAGALVSKGLSALGTTFRVGSYTNQNPQDNYLNFTSVMATEDNTQVTFSNLPTGLIIKNYTGTTPINIVLNEGESYTIATNSDDTTVNQDGLIGCLIQSNNPIVVNCGSTNGSFGIGGGRDYGMDQIVDLSKVGTEYIFVRGDGEDTWENVLIVAHTDNTTISINGNTPTTTINAGDYYVIEGHEYNNGNMYVQTSQPVFAYQGVGGLSNNNLPSEANQGLFFVPPLNCETKGNLDNIANINNIGSINYSGGITIVTKLGATVTINGAPIGITPTIVDGKPDYITYKVKGLNGNITVQSNDELYCAYFNYNGRATSGSFYSGFPSAPEINFTTQFSALGNCIPNIVLEAANTENFDKFKWFFDDETGSGFIDLAITTSDITPLLPGKYKLIGIIACTGEELESIEIPISICPDDRDNDGVIDNLDIDNDNDGILNCTESKGNVVLDLSNTNPPILRFQDGKTNTALATNSITSNRTNAGTNSIQLTALGNITSNIPATINGDNTYTINFTEPVNVKFSEDTSITNTSVNGEFFIAKIFPIDKNITLVDPDDKLLIDSNFDGVFETGVTMISGSEIHFKINPSATGTRQYNFYANQVNGFAFIHHLENTISDSNFSGNISLTCFKNDNDLDGIKDAFDLDSDNDGIPDSIENQGRIEALSLIDIDSNGLDDIFNISTMPIDTDNDNVLDFYDLDSDNDGIYDLIETGQLGILIDNDLNGIEDGPTYGLNGWTDSAETTPDSNQINYILNDLDNDTIFSYIDLDSDGDTCSDVIEAAFSDGNNDAILGDIIATTNISGLVNNATDGYTLPNTNYLDSAPLTISTQPTDSKICENSNNTFTIISPEAETYQWEVSTDNINWNTIIDNTIYSNSQTANLTLSNTPLTFNTYKYRVKIDRSGNSCGQYSNEVVLTISPLPIVAPSVILIQCDDDDLSTLGFSAFNLTEANNKISTNASNETFTYYLTQTAAQLGDNTSSDYIITPTTFENRNISSDIVWARIESTFGCPSIAQIQLNVSTTVIPSTFVVNFNKCDDFLDIEGNDNINNDDRDGIASFDFSSVSASILNFIPAGQTVSPPRYFRNEADALAEINEITNLTNYRNIGYPNSQYIFVRIDSDIANDCLALGPHILLNVETLPVINPVTIKRQCDDDTDGLYPFNTSQIENDILGTQIPAKFTFTYFDEMGFPLPSPLPNPFLTASQTITVRLTNNATLAPNGPCFEQTILTFTVDEQPFTNPIPNQIVCDGDAGDINNDGFYAFDTSTFTNTILGTQVGMEIYYDFMDEDGNLQSHQSILPNPLITESQSINVEVINPNNTTCIASTTINLIVNPLPEFTVETPRLVCSSNPNFTINLEPIETNNTEAFNYEWRWTSLDNTTINQFISNNKIIPVSTPGIYSITLTKTDGTNCSKTETIFVDASETANITQEAVTIIDLSDNNNTVTIDTTNLGMGNYEYALQKEGTNIINYQTSPFFNNVIPGFYTINVKDEICGISTLDISVIGYPKYFTPNGDGVNDVWQIQGIDQRFQSNSTILIFDRYGKLVKQLIANNSGWDGTFNGNIASTDDYWFKVILDDGRQFSGHFTLKR